MLIQPIPEPKTSSIILDVKTQGKLQPFVTGIVRAKGRGTMVKNTDMFNCDGKEIVMYPRNSGVEIEENGITYRLIDVEDLEAIL